MGVTVIAKSIVSNERQCFICHDTRTLHKHHIYGGIGRRELSEKFGCWVYLCPWHHNMSDSGVHFNKVLDLKLKQWCQRKFEEEHSREEFRRYFGRSYLEEEENE